MSILQDGAGIQWCCGQFLDCHPGWQKDLSLDVKQIEKTLNSFGMFTHGVSCFFISLGKFACIREQFKSSMSHLEVCDLAMRGCCDVVFFFPCVTDSEFEFRKLELHIFPKKNVRSAMQGQERWIYRWIRRCGFSFLGRFCEKDE